MYPAAGVMSDGEDGVYASSAGFCGASFGQIWRTFAAASGEATSG